MYIDQATLDTDRQPPLQGERARRPLADDRRPALRDSSAAGAPEENQAEHSLAQEVAGLVREIDGLRRRLLTQPAIEQAKGVLVASYGIDADTAFSVLVRLSQNTNTKLHVLAADLVAVASHSSGQPNAELTRLIDQLPNSGLNPSLHRGCGD